MQIRILTADDVKKALPMERAIAAMRLAYGQFSSGHATVPLRSRLHTEKGVTLLMPAHLHDTRDLAVKIVSVYGDNPVKGLPPVSAAVMVLDPDTGRPAALLEGDSLTALRTGAGGGLAADLLSRRDSAVVTLFGAGVQGRSQLQAVMTIRTIQKIIIVDPVEAAAHKLATALKALPDPPEIRFDLPGNDAVVQSDIVLAATTTRTPLFDGNRLKPGTHVTGVGSFMPEMQEIDVATIRRSRVVVDSREACLAEAGDLIMAKAEIDAEIGEIVNGVKPGRQNNEEITFFKSVGLAAQDAAAAAAVMAEAEKRNLGTLFRLA